MGKRVGLRTSGLEAREQRRTRVELVAIDLKGMSSSTGNVVALQNDDVLLVATQKGAAAQPGDAAPNHHHVSL